jgi:hypothetical protein
LQRRRKGSGGCRHRREAARDKEECEFTEGRKIAETSKKPLESLHAQLDELLEA